MEKPKTKRFLEELRSTNCRLESPTAVIIPNKVQNRAPRTGSGREANRALNLPTMPSSNIMAAPYWITRLLPTWRGGDSLLETNAASALFWGSIKMLIVSVLNGCDERTMEKEAESQTTRKLNKKALSECRRLIPLWFPGPLYLDWRRWNHFRCQKAHRAHRKYPPWISPYRDRGKQTYYSIWHSKLVVLCFLSNGANKEEYKKPRSYLLMAWMGGGGAQESRAQA